MNADGTGGTSSCDAAAHAVGHTHCSDRDNTCSGSMICCKDGSCQSDSSDCPEVKFFLVI